MDKREWLRSQGFEVGKRGRFSAEMLEALRAYDGGGVPTPTDNANGAQGASEGVPLPPQHRRTDGVTVYTATLSNNRVVNFDYCPTCKENVVYCECVEPSPPGWLANEIIKWDAGV